MDIVAHRSGPQLEEDSEASLIQKREDNVDFSEWNL